MQNTKIIVGIVIAIVVIGGIYYFWQRGGADQPGSSAVETPQGTAEAPGASAVTEEGLVVTASGEAAKNDAEPGTSAAPQQSSPIDAGSVTSKAIKLTMGGDTASIAPNNFKVKAGAVVTVSITSADTFSHVFKFTDPSLQAVAVGVGPDETRLISFNAPTKKGEYEFFCDVPGHVARGEVGVMVVE